MPQSSVSHTPIIAIVGRPNVGKSSLFNRLIHKRVAITSDVAGTTRDRIYYHLEIDDIPAILVDTGGMEYGKKENIEADVQSQARVAIKEADIILFVVDVSEALTANDYEAAALLRKTNKKVLLIGNKYDHADRENGIDNFSKLGFGEPLKISTIHKIGLDELYTALEKTIRQQGFKKTKQEPKDEKVIHVCFLGRPNVGKSSTINALLGEDKLIVSPIPGTTRDAVDTGITFESQQFNLIDTAGVRRRGKVRDLEKLSVLRSLEAVERADIVCLLLDYERGIAKQDMHISSFVTEAGKGLLLVVNKSDLMEEPEANKNRFVRILQHRFDFLPWAPVLFISALKKKNIKKILELSQKIQEERSKKIDDEELTAFMQETVYKHLPPKVTNVRPNFYELKQVSIQPPTFEFYVNDASAIHFSYRRYLENEMRKKYDFTGTAIKIVFKNRKMVKGKRRSNKAK